VTDSFDRLKAAPADRNTIEREFGAGDLRRRFEHRPTNNNPSLQEQRECPLLVVNS
jgi:hypothetical protein